MPELITPANVRKAIDKYQEANKQKIKERRAAHYLLNKERIQAKCKEYYQKNKNKNKPQVESIE